jgi:hypothetical protein
MYLSTLVPRNDNLLHLSKICFSRLEQLLCICTIMHKGCQTMLDQDAVYESNVLLEVICELFILSSGTAL